MRSLMANPAVFPAAFDHFQGFELLRFAHRIQLLKESRRVLWVYIALSTTGLMPTPSPTALRKDSYCWGANSI